MQDGSLENGDQANHVDHQQNGLEHSPPPNEPDNARLYPVNGQAHLDNEALEDEDLQHENNGNDAPANKKRKLTDSATPKAVSGFRPISPPWKRISVEGPTSFVEEGRRKSSRTNYVPIELQPQAGKRQTRAAIHQGSPVTKSKYGGAFKPSPLTSSTSTQTQSNVKGPHSAGKPTLNTNNRSPSKTSQPSTGPIQPSTDAPPPPKRSHKKKIRPISPTPVPPPPKILIRLAEYIAANQKSRPLPAILKVLPQMDGIMPRRIFKRTRLKATLSYRQTESHNGSV